MLDNDKIINIESFKTKNNIEIKTNGSYYRERFYKNNFLDGKDFYTFVKACEKMIRDSDKYSSYIGYLKNLGLNYSSIFGNISEEENDITIEFHHYPFTLYDICSIIMEYFLRHDKLINTFKIVKHVLNLHEQHLVGLVPLDSTSHTIYHDGELFIPLHMVIGRVDLFIEKYHDYISDDLLETYNRIVEQSNKGIEFGGDYGIINYFPYVPE